MGQTRQLAHIRFISPLFLATVFVFLLFSTALPFPARCAPSRRAPSRRVPSLLKTTTYQANESFFHYAHRYWSVEQGLPTNSVTSIAETKDGYIWLTTHEGLVRFDGVRFQTFNAMNTKEFASSYTTSAKVDGKGRLWFCIKGHGIVLYDKGQFTVFGAKQGLTSREISDLLVTSDNTVWVATDGGGLFQLKDGKFSQKTVYDGLPSNRLTSLYQDHHSRLWIGTTANGLSILAGNTFHTIDANSGLPSNRVSYIFQDLSDDIWVITDKGPAQFHENLVPNVSSKSPFPSDSITTATLDRRGGLWLGTDGRGIYRQTEEDSQLISPEPAMASSKITDILTDTSGNLWLATDGAGLAFIYRSFFEVYEQKDDLTQVALSMFEDETGTLWIGTRGGGLQRIGKKRITTYLEKHGLPQNQILSVLKDKSGRVFVGTVDNGIGVQVNDKSFTMFSSIIAGTRVSSLLEDRNGVVWAGLSRGLLRIQGNKTKLFSTEEGLPNENVKCLAEDRNGNLWIGTKGGLALHRDGQILREFKGRTLPRTTVVWIHVDGNNELWIGTYDSGLIFWGEDGVGTVTTRNGLFNDSVFSILEDKWNNLWMSSSNGVFRVSKEQLRRVALGKATQVKSQIFGVEEGLKTRECIGGGNNVAMKTTDGRLWFATIRGLAVIDPSKVRRQYKSPEVHIEQIWVDGQTMQDTDRLSLSKDAGRVRIRFTAPYFIAPERLKFKFKLDGFDTKWVEAGTDRTAHYTNLPPGNYTFRVFASGENQLWVSKTISIPVFKASKAAENRWYPLLLGATIWLIGTIILGLLLIRSHRKLYRLRKKIR